MTELHHQTKQLSFDSSVPESVKESFSDEDEFHCEMCGLCPGDVDDYTSQAARFSADWMPNNGLNSSSRFPDLRILCSTCNQGAKNITNEKPTAIWLLSQIRRAGQQEQRAVFEWLVKKFGKTAKL
jgi:5-methylcytosine-specific restriction endonuclease McrA